MARHPRTAITRDSETYRVALAHVQEKIAQMEDPSEWQIRHTRYGWPYEYPADGMKPPSGIPAKGLLPYDPRDPVAVQAYHTAKRLEKRIQEQAFQRGWLEATQQFAPAMLQLQAMFLSDGLAPDAPIEDRKLALATMKDILDRTVPKKSQLEIQNNQDEDDPLLELQALAKKAMVEGRVVDEPATALETWDDE